MREEIRKKLDDTILYLYREIRYPVFPVEPADIARRVYRCRYITYDELAATSKTSYENVVKACQSLDGSTQYDPATGRYLVAINTSDRYGASKPRIRWTTAHELGHIASGHFTELAKKSDFVLDSSAFDEYEEEADYFAASFLAPIPALKLLRVKRPADIRDWFGLSQLASEYRWADFQRQSGDIRLEDYFHIFRPKSLVKEIRKNDTRKIDIQINTDLEYKIL